jgi:hypothetical protein
LRKKAVFVDGEILFLKNSSSLASFVPFHFYRENTALKKYETEGTVFEKKTVV